MVKKIYRVLIIASLVFFVSGCKVDMSLSNNNVQEGSPVDTVIGELGTQGGGVAPYTYELVNGAGSDDNVKFKLNGSELLLNFVPDYDEPVDVGDTPGNNTYAVRVKSTDKGSVVNFDYSSATNKNGFYNLECYPNITAFSGVTKDGKIENWGNSTCGGNNIIIGDNFEAVYPSMCGFVARTEDGKLIGWGGTYTTDNIPTDTGYVNVYSTQLAYAARKSDGTIVAWGDPSYGGTGAPTGEGYITVQSNSRAFTALNLDGTLASWGDPGCGGTGAPSGNNFVEIYANSRAFVAIDEDANIYSWGDSNCGGDGITDGEISIVSIASTDRAFAAVRNDGTIVAWGDPLYGGTGIPGGNDFVAVYSNGYAFTAIKKDKTLVSWGDTSRGGAGAPSGEFAKVFSSRNVFVALREDGTLASWGDSGCGGTGTPTDSGYVDVYFSSCAVTARKEDGSVTSWGNSAMGGTGIGGNYITVYSNAKAFVGKELSGEIKTWGDSSYGGNYTGSDKFNVVNGGDENLSFEKKFIVNVYSKKTPIYRLYNKRTGVHLYTRGQADRDKILSKYSDFEFTDGAPAFYADLESKSGFTPIYRLYNKRTGVHLYTRGEADRDKILAKFRDFEFTDGAPAFYASLTPKSNFTPIYRLYNTRTGVHLYTRGEADRDKILAKFRDFEFTDGTPAFYAPLTVNENIISYKVSKNVLDEARVYYDNNSEVYLLTKGKISSDRLEEVDYKISDLNNDMDALYKVFDIDSDSYVYLTSKHDLDKFISNNDSIFVNVIDIADGTYSL